MTPEEKYNAALLQMSKKYNMPVDALITRLQESLGKSELCPEPEIKCWSDLVKAGEAQPKLIDIAVHVNKENGEWFSSSQLIGGPIERKALATLKIAQLIDAAYGGRVAFDEWLHGTPYGFEMPCDKDGSVDFNISTDTDYVCYDLLLFHTREQAERFLHYNDNLVRDYYMIERKED